MSSSKNDALEAPALDRMLHDTAAADTYSTLVQEKNEKNLNNNEAEAAAAAALVHKTEALNISKGADTGSVILDKGNASLRGILDAYDSEEDSASSGSSTSSVFSEDVAEDSNDSDSSTSDSDVEFITESQGAIKKRDKPSQPKDPQLQFMTELGLDILPPVPDLSKLSISDPKHEYFHMGHVRGIIDRVITVEALPNLPAYDIDTLLFYGDGAEKRPLGMVFDVIGQVTAPMYAVRFNSASDVAEAGVVKNMRVFSAPKSNLTNYVFVHELLKMKGTDASWIDDEEVPAGMQEFSDDETERAHKSALKQNRKRPHGSQERYKRYERAMNQCNALNSRVHRLIDTSGQQRAPAPQPPVMSVPPSAYHNVYENVRLAPWGYAQPQHPAAHPAAFVPYAYAYQFAQNAAPPKDGSGPSTSEAAPSAAWVNNAPLWQQPPGAWANTNGQYAPPGNDPSSVYKCP